MTVPQPPRFDNSYIHLPERFYTAMVPTPVDAPEQIAVNDDLALRMGLDPIWLQSEDGLAFLSGNTMPDGAAPLAQAYAGHQFGGWSPQLGDGRANLLGEVTGPDGTHWDIQLKGSGPTPYSRMGDGRAALGPVLREYIVSEAMHALGIPTTRALAAVSTGERVLREAPLPGAIFARVAASHLRVGTFQYFAARGDVEGVATLLDFAIARHYPDLEPGDALGFLNAVVAAQAKLIAGWMGLGFIHGVMNTDNTHLGGITIDYGPCAFLDAYIPAKVFSSIDQFGRYAYQAQPEIIVWNLAQLASSLLPLIDTDQDRAVSAAQEALRGYGPLYTEAWINTFGRKIGLINPTEDDVAQIQSLLSLMAEAGADFTQSFRNLAETGGMDMDGFADWSREWSGDENVMRAANPALIPRNHQVEHVIQRANSGDFQAFRRLHEALKSPFDPDPQYDDLRAPPAPDEEVLATFCGT